MTTNLTTVVKSAKKEARICRDQGVVIIGERINPTGRKVLRAELGESKFDMLRKDALARLPRGPGFWT